MGPRRLREGSEIAVTRPLVHLTPTQEAVQAVEMVLEEAGRVQLERRVAWRSVWERKRVRAAVSFEAVVKTEEWMRRRTRVAMEKKGV